MGRFWYQFVRFLWCNSFASTGSQNQVKMIVSPRKMKEHISKIVQVICDLENNTNSHLMNLVRSVGRTWWICLNLQLYIQHLGGIISTLESDIDQIYPGFPQHFGKAAHAS